MGKMILTIICILVLLGTSWGLYFHSEDKRIIQPCIAITIVCLIGFVAVYFTFR